MVHTSRNNYSWSHLTDNLTLSLKGWSESWPPFSPKKLFSLSKINERHSLQDLNADRNVPEGMTCKPTLQQTSPRSTGEEFLVELSGEKYLNHSPYPTKTPVTWSKCLLQNGMCPLERKFQKNVEFFYCLLLEKRKGQSLFHYYKIWVNWELDILQNIIKVYFYVITGLILMSS